MYRPLALAVLTSLVLLPCGLASAADEAPEEAEFTQDFPLGSCSFVPTGGNAFFSLRPGRQLYFSNSRCRAAGECEELEEVWITVLPETRRIPLTIDGKKRTIRTRVIEERETADGELEEISRNFFANCLPMRDVYYFGEDVFDGEGNPLADAWLAGRHGAAPGMIMPDAAFLLGSRYYQELAPGVALDRAEHVRLGVEIEVPAGVFQGCVEVEESSPLEPGHTSTKIYCPGVGLTVDNDLELVAVYGRGRLGDEEDDD
jgi:hypothetical protein